MSGGSRIAWFITALLAAAILAPPGVARAEDRIVELSETLASSSEKVRLSAVLALSKLGDRRAMKPLVGALADTSPQIRLVAAAALGKLGHPGSLPALKAAANDDADPKVRATARDAALAVAKANQIPPPWEEPAGKSQPAAAVIAASSVQPALYVLVNSSADDSPGTADKPTRKANADIVRQTLVDQCRSNPIITTAATDAKRLGLDPRNIDLSVVRMEVSTVGAMIEVNAQLRLAISDGRGKMLSFLSGGARVQVPKHRYDERYLPNLRREALESAMRGMFDALLAHLRDQRAMI
jgi:hypothetical protein